MIACEHRKGEAVTATVLALDEAMPAGSTQRLEGIGESVPPVALRVFHDEREMLAAFEQ
jgi:hypothetical protein